MSDVADEDQLIAGRWWEPGQRRQARHGVLHLGAAGVELRLTGVLRGQDDPYCTYPALLGEGASGDTFTLLDAESAGVASSMRRTRTSLSEHLRPRVVLKGEVGRSAPQSWSEVDLAFDYLDEWTVSAYGAFGEIADHGTSDDGGHWTTYRFEFPASLDAHLDFGMVTVWCGARQGGHGSWSGFQVIREPRLHVDLHGTLSLSQIEEAILKPLRYFFSFAMDAPVAVRGLTLRRGDVPRRAGPFDRHEVLFRRGDPPREAGGAPGYFEMLLPLSAIEHRFQAVMEGWFALWNRYEAVFDLILAPTSRADSIEAYFLQSVQAAELFHRRRRPDAVVVEPSLHKARLDRVTSAQSRSDAAWLRERLQWSNEPTLRSRIEDLVDESRLALRLSGNPEFSRRVAHSRNYLIHRSARLARHAASGPELWWLGLRLRALVRTLVLLDLGFDDGEAWDRLRDTWPVRQLMHHERRR